MVIIVLFGFGGAMEANPTGKIRHQRTKQDNDGRIFFEERARMNDYVHQ